MIPERRLAEHLARWLGKWPATREVGIIGEAGRALLGWDARAWSEVASGGRDLYGRELAVVTAPAALGRGLARRLVV
jgi:hypothetical protein